MSATYYDVNTHDHFDHVVGKFDIGKAPTVSHNSYLVVLFNFSSIMPIGSFEDIARSVFDNVSRSLKWFLSIYSDVLGYPSTAGLAGSLTGCW